MTNETGANRRRHRRVDVPLLVQLRYAATEPPRTVYALNVSERGLFVDVDHHKPIGTRVFVQITTRDGRERVRGEGRVVRREGEGVGIELGAFDAASSLVLQRIIDEADGSGA